MFRTPDQKKSVKEEVTRMQEGDEKKTDKSTSRPSSPPQEVKKEKKSKKKRKPDTSSGGDQRMADTAKSDEWMRAPDRLPILTKDNYPRWKYDINVILMARDLLKMSQGSEKLPSALAADADNATKEDYNKKYTEWVQRDAKAREILTRSLDSRHHDLIRSCTTAYGITKTLMSMHEQKSSQNLFLVQREYHECKWFATTTALEFISKVKTITNKMETLGEKVVTL